ncbi:hypothetical protein AB0C98_29180 [Streptomyces sp. NPDC048558]|uniref:effector-associated constant component EACC1 n=1 Tax=Streptomyces sp. NPDC048558 TaxID=3155759 RepID=UPI00341EA4DB
MPEAELRSLYMWLMADPAARRHAKPALTASQTLAPGAQGGTLDLVSLLVSSGFSAASLAMSVVIFDSGGCAALAPVSGRPEAACPDRQVAWSPRDGVLCLCRVVFSRRGAVRATAECGLALG